MGAPAGEIALAPPLLRGDEERMRRSREGATWEVRSENNMERVRAMIAPPSYLYEVSSARAPEGFHSVKEEPQRKDFQVDFPFENPTGYKKPTARNLGIPRNL